MIAPEPRLLILGSQSAPWGSHYVHRAEAGRMTALVRADGRSLAPQTTGGIDTLWLNMDSGELRKQELK